MKTHYLHKSINKVAQLITVFILSTSVSMASVIYSYVGNNYILLDPNGSGNIYDTSMRIELSFTVNNLLTNFADDASSLVTSFSIFDGVNLLTDSNAAWGSFKLNTDSSGNILQWDIASATDNSPLTNVGDRYIYIISQYIIGVSEQDGAETRECTSKPFGSCINTRSAGYSYGSGSHGTWSVSAVPIPAAAWLFTSGLLGLIGVARRKAD